MRIKGKAGPGRAEQGKAGTTGLCEPNNQLNVCTTSVTEGEVAGVKLV